jgi:proteasome accessory factor B
MFERDKDDLRSLGIAIDVGSFDPLFNDEAGYRIKSEKYELDLGEITPIEVSLLSLAADAWQDAALEDSAQSAIQKLSAFGVPADPIDIPGLSPKLSNSSTDLSTITDAIASTDCISFSYRAVDLATAKRTIVPIALSNKSGYWYVSGVDQEIQEVRTFRLDRIHGVITTIASKEVFEYPSAFELDETEATSNKIHALIDVRKGKGHALRTLATSIKDLGEWDQIKVPIFSLDSITAQILWHGEDVFVQEPAELRENIVEQLQALLSNHG